MNFSFLRWRFNVRRSMTKQSFPFFLGVTNNRLENPGEDFFSTLSMAPFFNMARISALRSSLLLLASGRGKGTGAGGQRRLKLET